MANDARPPATGNPPIQIRPFAPGDETRILESFNRVFQQGNPNASPRTLAHWRWKFERNPAGRRIVVAVLPEGRVVAHYAGIPARARLQDRLCCFTQPVDSFSVPDFRAGLKKPGLFVHTGWDWYERYGGFDKDPIIYGYPIPQAWRVGHRFLGYELVRPLNVLFREGPARGDVPKAVRVRVVDQVPDAVDTIWTAMQPDFEAAIVRDTTYLRWRYGEHPDATYRFLLAEDSRAPRGFAVMRLEPWWVPDASCLCDWMVPAADEEALAALVPAILRETERAKLARCCAFFPETSTPFLQFQESGFRVTHTRYIVVARSYVKRADMEWLRQHWYTTLGDSDLI